MSLTRLTVVFAVLFFVSCKTNSNKLFSLLPASETNIHFTNTILETPWFNVLSFEYIYNGAGVATGDVNNDGLPDLFFAGNQVSSKLYINKGNFRFEDVTEIAGTNTKYWCTGVSMVDINADGLMDISVATVNPVDNQSSPNLFFINTGTDKNGIAHFNEASLSMGIADTSYSTQTAFLDYDRDGDLDMYLLNNANVDYNRNEIRQIKNDGTAPSNDKLYRNDGVDSITKLPHFTDVSKQAGIVYEGWGLGVVVTDINKDGWPDIAVANDFISNDLLLINNQKGGFINDLKKEMRHTSQNSMGIDAADINNDGFADIATVDMKPFTNQRDKSLLNKQPYDKFYLGLQNGYEPQFVRNMLQVNNGNNTFSEVGQMAGMYATDWSWSILFADYDNNGNKDIYITNGYRKDVTDLDYLSYVTDASNFIFGSDSTKNEERFKKVQQLEDIKVPNFMYSNTGSLRLKDVTDAWGLNHPSFTNGAVYVDLDNDGDLDVVTNNINDDAFVYRNNSDANKNHFLNVKCKGIGKNILGVGAKVTIFYKDQIQYQELYPTRGYKSCMEHQLHFGLGNISMLDSVQLIWASGKIQTLKNIQTNQTILIEEENASEMFTHSSITNQTFFTQNESIRFLHHENDFIDFKLQPLLPYQYSDGGPCSAAGDVNGDGLDDIFVGGSFSYTSCIFIQNKQGGFTKTILETNKRQDDAAALLFDADDDGDNDLLVAAGGNEAPLNHINYTHRFFRNNGKGNFINDSAALPNELRSSAGTIVAADYDKDGDLDVLITGKVSPKNYPMPGITYLLQNNKGVFTDVTDKLAPGLRKAGMVSAALFTDYDNDGNIDLVIAGEWMPVSFFHNEKGKLIHSNTTGINNYTGMWNSLTSGDFDKDGDVDFIVGNLGFNNRFGTNSNEPVKVYAKDFNEDGRIDPLLTYYLNHKEVTVAYRDELIEQIITMRRRFQRYADLGKATIKEVLNEKELNGAYKASCNYTATSFIKNIGNGKFELSALPLAAQTAPVYGMVTGYFNNDENIDVLMIGNNYSTNVMHGWQDAFNGLLVLGNGKGGFMPQTILQSGFFNAKDGKSLITFMQNNKPHVAAFNNNSAAGLFAVNNKAVKYIALQAKDETAIITLADGKTTKADLNYGGGYCSQSSRYLPVPASARKIEISSRNQKKVITL